MTFVNYMETYSLVTMKRIKKLHEALDCANEAFISYKSRLVANNWKKMHGEPLRRKHR